MRVESAMTEFLMALEADGVRPATLKWYASLLSAFVSRFDGLELENVSTQMLRQYLVELRRRASRYTAAPQRPEITGGVSNETVRAHVRALRGFFAWCQREYRLPLNPMENIRQPKRVSGPPKAISLEDVTALLAVCPDDPEGRRDRALIAFLLDTGIRAQTVFKLQLAQLDLERRRAFVQEKGQSTRSVYFTERTAALLASWLDFRPDVAKTVFCSLAPHAFGAPMTPTILNRMLKRRAAQAGIKGPANPHAFRHAYAREYLSNGGNLATLSRLMGHSDVKVTADYYAIFADDELANNHERFSPLKGIDEAENTTN